MSEDRPAPIRDLTEQEYERAKFLARQTERLRGCPDDFTQNVLTAAKNRTLSRRQYAAIELAAKISKDHNALGRARSLSKVRNYRSKRPITLAPITAGR
jgi:hypothetical protein